MSASMSPVAAPGVAEGELRSQPLYHSRGSGSFSGIAYSVPGVSQRSAHVARTFSGVMAFPAFQWHNGFSGVSATAGRDVKLQIPAQYQTRGSGWFSLNFSGIAHSAAMVSQRSIQMSRQ